MIEQCIPLFRGLDIIREVIDLFEKLYKLFIFVFFFRVENNVTDEKFLGMKKKVILIDLRRGHRMEQ